MKLQSSRRKKNEDKEDNFNAQLLHAAYEVWDDLGSGGTENHYRNALAHALHDVGCSVITEHVVPVVTRTGHPLGFCRIDLVVNQIHLMEIKCLSRILPSHIDQSRFYLRQVLRQEKTNVKGITLINFASSQLDILQFDIKGILQWRYPKDIKEEEDEVVVVGVK